MMNFYDGYRSTWQMKAAAMTNEELAKTKEELETALRTIVSECEKHNVPVMIPMEISAACVAVDTETKKRNGRGIWL